MESGRLVAIRLSRWESDLSKSEALGDVSAFQATIAQRGYNHQAQAHLSSLCDIDLAIRAGFLLHLLSLSRGKANGCLSIDLWKECHGCGW